MQIGPHHFSGRFFLAPLAGVSDRPFRTICREMGASFAYTEMVSAHGLLHGTAQTLSYLDRDPAEIPFAVQIFASEPEALARGAAVAVEAGAGMIDINMACPVKKVCGTGAGAALARDPAAVGAAVAAAVAAVPGIPVTIKIRAGWEDGAINCIEVARAAEGAGASAVALHGRTRSQGYSGKARWELIRAVKEAVGIPVLGSGDVWTAADALRMRAETGCDAVLVARGACGNPWIFRELKAAERGEPAPPPPTREEWVEVVMRHVTLQIEHRRRQRPHQAVEAAEEQAVRELRRHLLWYSRGRRGGVAFRRGGTHVRSAAEVLALIDLQFPPGAPWELDAGWHPAQDAGGEEGVSELQSLALYTGAILAGAVAGGVLPLVGPMRRSDLLLSFSGGVMLGAAFFHMVPEAIELGGASVVPAVLLGFLALYLLERFVLIHICGEPGMNQALSTGTLSVPHDHPGHVHGDEAGCEVHTLELAAWVGMSIHTMVDGFALGAANHQAGLGLLVFIAILAHKIPSSFSLSAILRGEGYGRLKALWMNAFFALMVPIGAAVYVGLRELVAVDRFTALALAFSGGTFLHLSLSDILPDLHRRGGSKWRLTGALLAGLALMWSLKLIRHEA